jgi:hypothetical protein
MAGHKVFYAWLANKTSRQDDEPIKIRAKTIEEARAIALSVMDSHRFSLLNVYSASDFSRYYGNGWVRLLKGAKLHTYRPCGISF